MLLQRSQLVFVIVQFATPRMKHDVVQTFFVLGGSCFVFSYVEAV